MTRILTWLFFAVLFCVAASAFPGKAVANSDADSGTKHGLTLSDMKVEVVSQGRIATFQLYDTTAARQFYAQLPLELDLTNFRDAQWMFYPPEKLNVTADEAYHDGKKGELSYYAPWGDVFMLYKDFYAGDEMHRLGIGLSGVDAIEGMSGHVSIRKMTPIASEEDDTMQIAVVENGKRVVFALNDSHAAKELYEQLPLNITVEDYAGLEKIFYPSKKLNTSNTPLVKAARTGTLAYYAPWGDVVMFYGRFGSAAGLYELGHAIAGKESLGSLSGSVRIEAVDR